MISGKLIPVLKAHPASRTHARTHARREKLPRNSFFLASPEVCAWWKRVQRKTSLVSDLGTSLPLINSIAACALTPTAHLVSWPMTRLAARLLLASHLHPAACCHAHTLLLAYHTLTVIFTCHTHTLLFTCHPALALLRPQMLCYITHNSSLLPPASCLLPPRPATPRPDINPAAP